MENLNSSIRIVKGDCHGEVIYVRETKIGPGGHKGVCLMQVSPSIFLQELLNCSTTPGC